MEEVIKQNEAKTSALSEYIRDEFIPSVQQKFQNTSSYLTSQQEDFQQYEVESENLLNDLMVKKTEWSKNLKQLSEKNQKESDLQKRVEDYKKAKKTDLINQQKTIDSLSSAMKEACSKVKPELVAKISPLPEILQNLFKGLFFILFDIPQEKFNWEDFKKKCLLFEKGEDFQSRLANFSFRNVPPQKLDTLQMLQSDKELDKLLEDRRYTEALIDLVEWLTFAVNGVKYAKSKDDLQAEYDKICRDFDNRGKELSNSQKSQEFWEASFNYVDDQTSFISEVISVLKGVQFNIKESGDKFNGEIQNFVDATNEMNKFSELPKF